jgi:hypothetical protein
MVQKMTPTAPSRKREAGPGEKPAKRPARKSLMKCLCREAKAELRMKNEIGRNGNAI